MTKTQSQWEKTTFEINLNQSGFNVDYLGKLVNDRTDVDTGLPDLAGKKKVRNEEIVKTHEFLKMNSLFN